MNITMMLLKIKLQTRYSTLLMTTVEHVHDAQSLRNIRGASADNVYVSSYKKKKKSRLYKNLYIYALFQVVDVG